MWQTARISSRPWWWRFASLSLRGMIVILAAIAAPLVWFSKSVRRMIVLIVVIATPLAWIASSAACNARDRHRDRNGRRQGLV